jgi:hypothetical protein
VSHAAYATAFAVTAPVPSADKYGTKIATVAVPPSCRILGLMGYGVGKLRDGGVTWFNVYFDGEEICDGFDSANEAWDCAGRHEAES